MIEDSDDEREPDPGTPRWVIAFAAVGVLVVLLLVVLLVAGGGHGPGRHSANGIQTAVR